jgi:hypothetical protein
MDGGGRGVNTFVGNCGGCAKHCPRFSNGVRRSCAPFFLHTMPGTLALPW